MINLIKKYKFAIGIVSILLLLFLFRHLIIIHKDFFEMIFKAFTVIIACLALSTWKEELKAKKLYELNTKAYNILLGIKNCITESFLKEDLINDDNGDISYLMCDFFRTNLKDIQTIYPDLVRIKQNVLYFEYFKKLAEKYSIKNTDDIYFQEQEYNNETGDLEPVQEEFNNWFWSDYTRTKADDSPCDFQIEFDKNLEKGLKFYDGEIAKYYK